MFCWLTTLIFFEISPSLPVRVGDDEKGTESTFNYQSMPTQLPFQPRRPPIFFSTIPECYFILSDIRLKMSFLVLFKNLHEQETLAAERLRVLCSCFSFKWVLGYLELLTLMLVCLLFRKPPDPLFYMQGFVIEVKAQRGRVTRMIIWILLFVFGALRFASNINKQDLNIINELTRSICVEENLDEEPLFGLSAAFLAEHYATSHPREMGAWEHGIPTLSQFSSTQEPPSLSLPS